MARYVSKRDESVRMFENPILEYLSRAHPLTPLFYAPLLAYFLYLAVADQGWLTAGGLFVGGMALWTLTEYWVHRTLFHFEPRTAWGKRIHYLWHGVHHDYPRDSTRLVMPLMTSLPLAAVLYLLFRIFAGSWHPALFAGFILGYIAYDLTHYALHHWHVRNRVFLWLRKHHLRHHFADDQTGYGVTTPFWDVVFRTQVRPVELKAGSGAREQPVAEPATAPPPVPPAPEAPLAASN